MVPKNFSKYCFYRPMSKLLLDTETSVHPPPLLWLYHWIWLSCSLHRNTLYFWWLSYYCPSLWFSSLICVLQHEKMYCIWKQMKCFGKLAAPLKSSLLSRIIGLCALLMISNTSTHNRALCKDQIVGSLSIGCVSVQHRGGQKLLQQINQEYSHFLLQQIIGFSHSLGNCLPIPDET